MYFITCFTKINTNEYGLNIGLSRTFGYFEKYEDAHQALRINCCDMFETIYHYAVVEHIEPGIYSIADKRWFYKYDKEKDGYCPIEEPKEFEHYSNIALG